MAYILSFKIFNILGNQFIETTNIQCYLMLNAIFWVSEGFPDVTKKTLVGSRNKTESSLSYSVHVSCPIPLFGYSLSQSMHVNPSSEFVLFTECV